MKELERRYTSDRGKSAETYQSLTVTKETSGRGYVLILELGFMQRWRSVEEAASYLRWAADELETLKKVLK